MSVTNAISSVIIVGALIAALVENPDNQNAFQLFGSFSNTFGSHKYFGGLSCYSENASNVIKKRK